MILKAYFFWTWAGWHGRCLGLWSRSCATMAPWRQCWDLWGQAGKAAMAPNSEATCHGPMPSYHIRDGPPSCDWPTGHICSTPWPRPWRWRAAGTADPLFSAEVIKLAAGTSVQYYTFSGMVTGHNFKRDKMLDIWCTFYIVTVEFWFECELWAQKTFHFDPFRILGWKSLEELDIPRLEAWIQFKKPDHLQMISFSCCWYLVPLLCQVAARIQDQFSNWGRVLPLHRKLHHGLCLGHCLMVLHWAPHHDTYHSRTPVFCFSASHFFTILQD